MAWWSGVYGELRRRRMQGVDQVGRRMKHETAICCIRASPNISHIVLVHVVAIEWIRVDDDLPLDLRL